MNIDYSKFKTPGQLIESLLSSHDWSQRTLAIVLGVEETGLSKLISGKKPITAEFALALHELFNVPAERFMELQQSYDLAKARIVAQPDPGRENRARLFGGLPIADMLKRGWLSDVDNIKNVANVEKSLAKFFGVASVSEIEILPHAAKRTEVSIEATPAQLAWLYRVRQIASEMLVSKYSQAAVKSSVQKLSSLLLSREEVRKVPRILAECGIRFVIVESLPSAKIDGVCFWLDDNSPVIGMSLRHDRIDNFWFVLRHELEHVIQLHGRAGIAILDTELEGDRAGTGENVTEEERVANTAAADFCVSAKLMKAFIDRKAPFFAEQDILGFAALLKVHPGLVAGQLRHATARYDRFTNHLVKIRSVIAPSAVVDGWGDVAPVGL